MEELNRKLAEWAGLQYLRVGLDKWLWHTQHYQSLPSPPDFPKSLDACFKWLVPKGNLFQIIFTDPSGNSQLPRCDIRPLGSEDIYGFGETFAIALCKAIEKLIDGEK